MAVTLITDISGEFSNSYVDIAYADDYWGDHFDTVKADAWAALSDEQKTRLLIRATRIINTLRVTQPTTQYEDYSTLQYDRGTRTVKFTFLDRETPRKFYWYQALQFPRTLDRATDGTIYIPEPVKMAECEQAVYSLTFDDGVISNKLQGVSRDSTVIGPITVTQKIDSMGSELSPTALEFLRIYILKISNRIARG